MEDIQNGGYVSYTRLKKDCAGATAKGRAREKLENREVQRPSRDMGVKNVLQGMLASKSEKSPSPGGSSFMR